MSNTANFIELNLLPAEYSRKRGFRVIRGEQLLIGLLLGLVLFVVLMKFQNDVQANIERLDYDIKRVQSQIDENKSVKTQIDALQKKRDKIIKKITSLKNIKIKRDKWVRIMEEIEMVLPPETWIELIQQEKSSPNSLKITGKTYDFDYIGSMIKSLQSSQQFTSVDLRNVEQATFNKEKIYGFNIFVDIKSSKPKEEEDDRPKKQ